MTFKAFKNPSEKELIELITNSKHQAVRRIQDKRNGEYWCWDAALATHAEGAAKLGIPYDKPAGTGEILTL